ncbi:unnamed protein product [Pylaiella littoralis]
MPRVAACGRSVHGKAAAAGGLRLCYACDRPGSRKWKHMGDSEWWANLGAWSSREGKGWPHERDLQAHKLEVGECICSRADCVAGMYGTFKTRREKEERGSTDRMEIGWSSPMVRYPSTSFQVRALLEHVELDGSILGCCGGETDVLYNVLPAHGLPVATNDFNGGLRAGSHMDATTVEFAEAFLEDARRPDWS